MDWDIGAGVQNHSGTAELGIGLACDKVDNDWDARIPWYTPHVNDPVVQYAVAKWPRAGGLSGTATTVKTVHNNVYNGIDTQLNNALQQDGWQDTSTLVLGSQHSVWLPAHVAVSPGTGGWGKWFNVHGVN